MRRLPLTTAVSLTLCASTALAGPQAFSSARSFAMGGTGVAIAHPGAAGTSNPAMLAANHHEWSDDFAMVLPSVNARFADDEETVDQIDRIQETIDAFQQAQSNNNVSGARQNAGQLRDQLNAFDRDTVRVDAGLGLALAVPSPNFAVGFFANGNLRATARGEFDESDEALLATLENGTPTELATADLDQDLQSRGKVLASAVSEAGISFARSIELSNGEQLQLGVSPKFVQLRTFQYTETVSGFDDDNFDAEDAETTKNRLNVDLGAAYSFGQQKQWKAGAVVKNLVPMELDSARSKPLLEQQRTLEVGPLITTGVSHIGQHHVVTAELDLTKNEAFGYEDDTQWLALGAEFDAWRFAQLRAGLRHNLASNGDSNGIAEDTQATFGIGLSPFGAHLELAGLISDTEKGASIELGTAF
ncbi:conjugal transfer protein TraF [Tamilnaduibacter salinus]|nr:conjugal transfer protein TraF [Tamilnaduibacter salinus]